MAEVVHAAGYDSDRPDSVFATFDALRTPIDGRADLVTAGDSAAVRTAAHAGRSGRRSGAPGGSAST